MDSGENIFVDRSEQEDEQRLREVMCERRVVSICCHDSPHDEAVDPRLRPFHTVSEGEFYEVRVRRVLRPSLLDQTDPHQAALKNTMADAPTTTNTNTRIKIAGSSTTSSALPVVVACISRIPTVAR